MNKKQWLAEYIAEISKEPNDRSSSSFLKLYKQKEELVPKKLFKFDALPKAEENSKLRFSKLNSIKFSRIWMSNPVQFNDPYDCMLGYDIDQAYIPNADVIKVENNFGIRFKRTNNRVLMKDFRRSMIKLIEIENGPFDNEAYVEARYETNAEYYKATSFLRSSILASCFTEHRDNLPMWAHYANNNSGYCLEFDFRKNNIHGDWEHNWINQLYPVVYNTIRPNSAGQSGENFNGIYHQTRLTKSKEWEYESEWRYIPPFPYDNIDEIEPIGRLAIAPKLTAIYLGVFMSDEDVDLLTQVASFQKIPIFKMRPDIGTYLFRPKLLKDYR